MGTTIVGHTFFGILRSNDCNSVSRSHCYHYRCINDLFKRVQHKNGRAHTDNPLREKSADHSKIVCQHDFTTMIIGGLFILFCVAFGVQYGVLGWNADIQANLGLSLMGVNLPLNNLQLIFFGLGVVWLAGIFAAAVTAMISAVTKTPFSSLIVAFSVFMAPWIIRQLLPESTLRDLLIVFPANAVNAHEVLLLPVNAQSIFYNQPLAPALCIAFATIIMLLVSSAIAYKAFKNHQTAN